MTAPDRSSVPQAALALCATLFVAGPALACDPVKLLGEMPAAGDRFGHAVATNGERIVVGADAADLGCTGNLCDLGFVEVWVPDGDAWAREAVLFPEHPAEGDAFGASVAIDGRRIAVGSLTDRIADQAGAVDLFVLDDGQWLHDTRLVAPEPAAGDEFGYSVAIQGDLLVVGSPGRQVGEIEDAGAVFVFEWDGLRWRLIETLSSTAPKTTARFGQSVAIDGDLIVVGETWADNDGGLPVPISGAAFVFERRGEDYGLVARLAAPVPAALDFFGLAVAVRSPDLVVIGAPGDDDMADDGGAAHAFRAGGDGWEHSGIMYSLFPVASGRFGTAISLEGSALVIGEAGGDAGAPASGAAYLFNTVDEAAAPVGPILPNDGDAGDGFGASMAFSGTVLVIGAPQDDDACPASPTCDSGSAYVFRVLDPACPGDLDGDDVIGIRDLLAVLANWGDVGSAADCVSDLNGDGGVDAMDLTVLIEVWGPCD